MGIDFSLFWDHIAQDTTLIAADCFLTVAARLVQASVALPTANPRDGESRTGSQPLYSKDAWNR